MKVEFSAVAISLLTILLVLQYINHQSHIIRISKLINSLGTRKNKVSFIRFGPKRLHEAISDLELLHENIVEIERRFVLEDFNLKAILSAMTEGVFVTNASGVVILANDQLTKMLQLKSCPLHKTVLEALGNHQISHAVKEVLRNQTRGRWELTLRPTTDPAANPLNITLTLAPILNSQGEVFGSVAVLHDVTALKKMELLQREFVSNTSHELRTPLAIFRGYLEELIEAPPTSRKDLLRILQSLLRQTDRLEALVQDLLTLSQFESRTITLRKKPVVLSCLIEETISELRRVRGLGDCTITLKSRFSPAEDLVWADENRVKQVIFNLIENSIKYSGEKGLITITTNPGSSEQMVECSVIDYGIGIPEKDLPYIFDRFYRADKGRVRSTGGTGLGLSIVKQIVEAHGGMVTAKSQINQGTTITFSLPRPPEKILEVQENSNLNPTKTSYISNRLKDQPISRSDRVAIQNS